MPHNELKLENQLCFRLYTASRLIIQAYTPLLSKLGITYPQYLVMMVLWEKETQFVNEIAMKLQLETNTITPLLQRMEKMGLIERKRSLIDRRQTNVMLTQKGKDLEEKAFGIVPSGMMEQLNTCPLKFDDYVNLAAELDSIIDTLKNKVNE